MGDLLDRIQTIDLNDGLFPSRPDYGDQGVQKNVPLWANYFEMVLRDPKMVLYLYKMNFEAFPPKGSPPPEKAIKVPEGKKLVQVIRCALETSTFKEIQSNIATDFGKMMISCKKLDSNQMQTGQFKFWAENEIENGKSNPRKKAIRFQMTLEDSGEIRVSDLLGYLASSTKECGPYERILPIVQALDIILGHYGKLSLNIATPKRSKCFPLEPTGSEKFKLEGPIATQGYLQGVRGFFASVRATTDRTLVNCNACCGAFYKPGPLESLFAMFITGKKSELKDLEKAIQGLRVALTHLKDEKGQPMPSLRTISGLARPYGGPNDVTFYHKKEEKTYTVAEYWKQQGYDRIRNFTYPVIDVGNKKHPTFLPPEVCQIISGQTTKRKLDPIQNSDMIKSAIRRPEETRKSINADAFRILGLNNNPTLASTSYCRVLKQPAVIYQIGSTPREIGENGRWNLRGVTQVLKPGRLEKWAILRITRNAQDPKGENSKFEETLRGFLRTLEHTLGKSISKPIQLGRKTVDKGDKVALGPNFLDCQEQGINFLVIVLPDSDASTYKQIKTFGDIEYGITTVCVLDEARKFYAPPYGSATQYFANVALKINLKLGGTNHVLRNQTPLYETTMVIGIDVTHPSPGSTKKTAPSVAAMVASVDSELAQWPVDLRINTARKEMVELLGPMLVTRLELWQSKHGQSLPDNLLIYRDGVSENQYKAVLQQELGELQNACEVIYTGRKLPCITLIIVGKRHHTRFFKKIGPGNCTNPEFGTVVDTGVTEAHNWDFFLQSHHALQGTARPAHYFVLLNEIFTQEFVGRNVKISDYLQKLTYDMCFLFGRSTGPISIPPPVYYADIACERSRCYGDFDDDMSDTSSTIGDDRGKPQRNRGGTQPTQRGHGTGPSTYGTQGPSKPDRNTPGPSKGTPNKQGSGYTAPGKPLRPTEGKQPDMMAGLSKKEKARLFEERIAANQQATKEGSSKVEGKKAEAKPEPKAKEKVPEEKTGGTKPEGEVKQLKVEGKKPETQTPKEKAKVEINALLKDKMFYV